MKKKKSLWNIFLLPILIIVFVQGAVPFLTLIFSGIRSNMENAVIGLDSHTVENRKVVLENDMIEQWSSVYKESDSLSSALTKVLSDHQMDMQGFMGSGKVQEEYLETVFYDMVEVLQYNSTSGIFLVLGNDGDTDSEGEYKGFWVRDSDPQTKTASRTDLLMERGSKVLSQNMSISLDTSWHTDFRFQGNGKRAADDFFYQPYITAENYVDSRTSMKNLGYWSKPFILEDFYKDNHKMITYSAPLVYDKTVYGVLGIEVGVNDLAKYFPVKDRWNLHAWNNGLTDFLMKYPFLTLFPCGCPSALSSRLLQVLHLRYLSPVCGSHRQAQRQHSACRCPHSCKTPHSCSGSLKLPHILHLSQAGHRSDPRLFLLLFQLILPLERHLPCIRHRKIPARVPAHTIPFPGGMLPDMLPA